MEASPALGWLTSFIDPQEVDTKLILQTCQVPMMLVSHTAAHNQYDCKQTSYLYQFLECGGGQKILAPMETTSFVDTRQVLSPLSRFDRRPDG